MRYSERAFERAEDGLMDAWRAFRARAWVAMRRHLDEAAQELLGAAGWLDYDEDREDGPVHRRWTRAVRIHAAIRRRLPERTEIERVVAQMEAPVIPLCSTCRLWGQGACRLHQKEVRR